MLEVKNLDAFYGAMQVLHGVNLAVGVGEIVGLVGANAAGKSSLMNALTDAGVLVADQLFATLDPTVRVLRLPEGGEALIVDTVGFIHKLPHGFVDAFKSTLEEVQNANLLLHVIGGSDPHASEQVTVVESVLGELGAGQLPRLTVFNKADLVKDQYTLRELTANTPNSVYISARTAEGMPHLMDRVVKTMEGLLVDVSLRVPYDRSDLVAQCYEYGHVLKADYREDGIYVDARITHDLAGRVRKFEV